MYPSTTSAQTEASVLSSPLINAIFWYEICFWRVRYVPYSTLKTPVFERDLLPSIRLVPKFQTQEILGFHNLLPRLNFRFYSTFRLFYDFHILLPTLVFRREFCFESVFCHASLLRMILWFKVVSTNSNISFETCRSKQSFTTLCAIPLDDMRADI